MTATAKIQRSKVGIAGSFINQLMGNNATLPEVGKGATILHYTDRSAYEVVEVSADGKTCRLQSLNARWNDKLPGGMGHQNWLLEPTDSFMTLSWKWGAWRQKSERVMFTEEYAATLGPKFSGSDDQKRCFIDGEMVVVDGITELKVEWHPVKVIFGRKDYYYDWSF